MATNEASRVKVREKKRHKCRRVESRDMSKRCPICRSPMHKAGKLRPAVSKGKARLITVYVCSRCGYRTLGD